jgi:hypothetical protein
LRTAAKVAGAIVAIRARSHSALLGPVDGSLVARTVATIMSYVVHPHRPRPTLAARGELLGYSIWLCWATC